MALFDDEDHNFELMLIKLEQERIEEEKLKASLQNELAYYEKLTDVKGKEVQNLRLEVENAINTYERDLRIQMNIDKKLSEAGVVVNSLKDNLIFLGNMLPGYDKLKEFFISQVEAGERKLSALEAELRSCDIQAEYDRLEVKLAEITELERSEKEYYEIKIAELEEACKQREEEHIREKKRLDSLYEPQIKKFREGSEYFEKRLQEEREREEFLREKLAEEKEKEESLTKQMAQLEADCKDFTKSSAELIREKELKLAQMQAKLEEETKNLLEAQKLEKEMRNDNETQKERVDHLRSSNDKLREQVAKTSQKRKEEEEALAAVEECNSSLEETVKSLTSGLSVTCAKNSEIKQKIQRIQQENMDLNKVLRSNRNSFEETYDIKIKQLNELKARRLALEESLSPTGETEAKLEAVQKEKKTLIAENRAIDKQIAESERKITGHVQDIDESKSETRKLNEKLVDIYHDWSIKAASINLAIEDKRALREAMSHENAKLMIQVKELKVLEEKGKTRLAQRKSEVEKSHCKLTEDCNRKLKVAEDEHAALKKEMTESSAKYMEMYRRMEQKLENRNKDVATQQEQLASTLEEYKKLQENIAHVQELLYQNMEKDNEQIMRKMTQQVKEHFKGCEVDHVLPSPTLSTPILSSESAKKLSSGAEQSESSSQKTLPQTGKSSQKLSQKSKLEENSTAAPFKKGTRKETKKPVLSKKNTRKDTKMPPPSEKDTYKGSKEPSSPWKDTRKETFLVPPTPKKGSSSQEDKHKETGRPPSSRRDKDTCKEPEKSSSSKKDTPKLTRNVSSWENNKVLSQPLESSPRYSEVSSTGTSDSQRLSQPLTQVVSQSSGSIELVDIGSDSGLSGEMF